MISQYFEKSIDEYSKTIKQNNRIFRIEDSVRIGKLQLGLYLYNLYQLSTHTQKHLISAKKKSLEQNKMALALHFEDEYSQVVGSEKWILNDIESFEFETRDLFDFYITPSMKAIIRHVEHLSLTEPESYLAYSLLTGMLTLNLAPSFLEFLQEYCGVSLTQIKVLEKFLSIDDQYNIVDLEPLNEFIDSDKEDLIKKNCLIVIKLFDSFLNEVADNKQERKHLLTH